MKGNEAFFPLRKDSFVPERGGRVARRDNKGIGKSEERVSQRYSGSHEEIGVSQIE